MDTSKLNLLVYDSKDNFEKTKSQLGFEGSTLKRIFNIQDINELSSVIDKQLNDDDLIFLAVHVFAKDNIKGIKHFKNNGITEKYPKLEYMFISDGASKEIQKQMVEDDLDVTSIYRYHQVLSELKSDRFKAITKKELLSPQVNFHRTEKNQSIGVPAFPKIKYAIITALYKDEFEELKKVFEFPENEQFKTDKKIFYKGYLKSNKNIEVVAAVPNSTGMLDSSIIATLLLEHFKPDYLLMSGVCGASSNYNFGDIIIAKQVFTFQKGKISDIKRKDETGKLVKIDLFDNNKEPVDYSHLFDNDGNQVAISIEKFEVEHDAIIHLDYFFEDLLNPKLVSIRDKINSTIATEAFFSGERKIKIVVEPMACSTMVINKEGYFEDTIKSVHRKTAAVEMESYGVARACQFANNGKTKPLIFKAVMDNTVNKADVVGAIDWKKFAAFTSAQFMKHLFEEKVI